MSEIVTTKVGRFRRVNTGDPAHPDAWLFECPCGQWAYLDEDQWAGRVSVDHASDGCPNGYHETHNYGAELVATMQARILTGDSPLDPEPGEQP
jgi:hypothetical protein